MGLDEYKRKLFSQGGGNVHKTPWTSYIIRNKWRNGNLVSYKSHQQYKNKKTPMWVLCQMLLFRDDIGLLYPVFFCNSCPKMQGIEALTMTQTKRTTQAYKCTHSRLCDLLVSDVRDWRYLWDTNVAEIDDNCEIFELRSGQDIKYETYKDNRNDLFLGATYDVRKNKVTILNTMTGGLKTPVCSNACVTRGCKCVRNYEQLVTEHRRALSGNPNLEVKFFWNRTKQPQKQPPQHYDCQDEDKYQYGFNKAPVKLPIRRDVFLKQKFEEQRNNSLVYPDRFVPRYEPNNRCKHGHLFSEDDTKLKVLYNSAMKYSENCEEKLDIPIYGRPSASTCKCVQQPDTHPWLMWNAGGGHLLCYQYLLAALMKFNSGVPYNAQHSARADSLSINWDIKTALGYHTFLRSVIGKINICGY